MKISNRSKQLLFTTDILPLTLTGSRFVDGDVWRHVRNMDKSGEWCRESREAPAALGEQCNCKYHWKHSSQVQGGRNVDNTTCMWRTEEVSRFWRRRVVKNACEEAETWVSLDFPTGQWWQVDLKVRQGLVLEEETMVAISRLASTP